jgi:hypothetical protein
VLLVLTYRMRARTSTCVAQVSDTVVEPYNATLSIHQVGACPVCPAPHMHITSLLN